MHFLTALGVYRINFSQYFSTMGNYASLGRRKTPLFCSLCATLKSRLLRLETT